MNTLRATALALSISLSGAAFADTDGQRETVERLLDLMDMPAMMDGIDAQLDQMAPQLGQQMGIPPSEQALFNEFMSDFMALKRKEMTWERMKEPMVDIYLRHYTEQELQDMLAFYSSETGQSVVAKMPQVVGESMQVSQQLMRDFLPKVRALAESYKKRRQSTDE